jgi:anti-anti-sigma factor
VIAELTVRWLGGGQAVVELHGEYDLETSEELRACFDAVVNQNSHVVIDLSNAEFIDSSVLNNLARAHRNAREQTTLLRVQVGDSPIVRKVLEIGGLLSHLDCVEEREQALAPPDPVRRVMPGV